MKIIIQTHLVQWFQKGVAVNWMQPICLNGIVLEIEPNLLSICAYEFIKDIHLISRVISG